MLFVAFAAPVVLMFLFSLHTLSSIYQDIGRHITLGRIIWETHQIPTTNLFSYTARDFPFLNHHWLGEVALYLGDRAVGLAGLIMAKAVLITAAVALALAACWRRRLAVPAMVIATVAAFIMVERTDVRPEVIGFLFLGWYLFVLYRRSDSRLVWTLPFAQLLWVNAHISFFMGPLVLVAWLIGRVAADGLQTLQDRRMWLFAMAIAVATLVNPHGIFGALYPLQIFGNYGYSIVENKSPFFLAAFGYPQMTAIALYAGIVLTAVSFVLNGRRIRHNVFGLILFLATAVFALTMVRNFPLFALCMVPIVLRNCDETGLPWGGRWVAGAGMLTIALFGASVVTGQIYEQAGLAGRQFGLRVPAGPQWSVDFFRSAGIRGPIFNNFDVGSFLIWKLPEEPVFIDGRPEAYPADFIQNTYIAMQESGEVWREESVRYNLNAIFWDENDITPWSRIFVARIRKDAQWALVWRGEGILILVKNTPANQGIIATHRLK